MARHKHAVDLDTLADRVQASSGGKSHGSPTKIGKLLSFKILVAIFVMFALVVSDVFTDNVVSGFRDAVRGRTPTTFGVAIQGIFLVIFYVIFLHLIEGDLI